MFSRFFQSRILPSKILSNTRVKRMSPETTIDFVQQELQAELEEYGLEKLRHTLNEEQIVLETLQTQQKESIERIREECVAPTLKRFFQGNDIGGLSWEQKQREKEQITSRDQLQKNEEEIDWLKTRQSLFPKLIPG